MSLPTHAQFIAAERPLTQHGLSGLPTTASTAGPAGGARLGTAGNRLGTATGMRQIKDKRYWQSQLQVKMNEIQRETEKLARERDTMLRERSAKRSFEKRVQEAAKELTGKVLGNDMMMTMKADVDYQDNRK